MSLIQHFVFQESHHIPTRGLQPSAWVAERVASSVVTVLALLQKPSEYIVRTFSTILREPIQVKEKSYGLLITSNLIEKRAPLFRVPLLSDVRRKIITILLKTI